MSLFSSVTQSIYQYFLINDAANYETLVLAIVVRCVSLGAGR